MRAQRRLDERAATMNEAEASSDRLERLGLDKVAAADNLLAGPLVSPVGAVQLHELAKVELASQTARRAHTTHLRRAQDLDLADVDVLQRVDALAGLLDCTR